MRSFNSDSDTILIKNDYSFIVLEHDLFQQTVDLAVGYTLNTALSFQPQLTLEPIGKCQGWPATNLYLETTTNTTFPYPDTNAADAATTTASARAAAASSSSGATSGNSTSATSSAAISAHVAIYTSALTLITVVFSAILSI